VRNGEAGIGVAATTTTTATATATTAVAEEAAGGEEKTEDRWICNACKVRSACTTTRISRYRRSGRGRQWRRRGGRWRPDWRGGIGTNEYFSRLSLGGGEYIGANCQRYHRRRRNLVERGVHCTTGDRVREERKGR